MRVTGVGVANRGCASNYVYGLAKLALTGKRTGKTLQEQTPDIGLPPNLNTIDCNAVRRLHCHHDRRQYIALTYRGQSQTCCRKRETIAALREIDLFSMLRTRSNVNRPVAGAWTLLSSLQKIRSAAGNPRKAYLVYTMPLSGSDQRQL